MTLLHILLCDILLTALSIGRGRGLVADINQPLITTLFRETKNVPARPKAASDEDAMPAENFPPPNSVVNRDIAMVAMQSNSDDEL